MSSEHPLYYVVLVPSAQRTRAAVECLAHWLNVSRYDAKLKLSSAIPQILRAMSNRGDAVEMQVALDAVQVRTRCLAHRQIVHPPALFQATACHVADPGVTFLCREGEQFAVSESEAKVLVKARVRKRTETRRHGRQPSGYLTRSRGDAFHSVDSAFVMYFYTTGPRVLQVVQNEFDYDCLAGGKSMSSLRNFQTLARLLRMRFPDAVYDETLCAAAGQYEKVDESYMALHPYLGAAERKRSRTFTDERFVRDVAWLIALAKSDEEWSSAK